MQLGTPIRGAVAAAFLFVLRVSAQSSVEGSPERFRWYGEVQARYETARSELLSRLRLGLETRVAARTRAVVEVEDARTTFVQLELADLRQAYFETELRDGWTFRVGRQEIAFGDERLVGADSRWGFTSPRFDSVSTEYRTQRWRAGLLLATPVRIRPAEMDDPIRKAPLGMVYFTRNLGRHSLEPYLIHGRHDDGLRRTTGGFRAIGQLHKATDYNLEVATQTGSSWASHFEGGRTFAIHRGQIRAWLEFNYASGRFHDFWPAAYNSFGIEDPYAWRDSRWWGVGAQFDKKRLRVLATYRDYHRTVGGASLGTHWIAGGEFRVTRFLTAAGAIEGYPRTSRQPCSLHPLPKVRPFVALSYRF